MDEDSLAQLPQSIFRENSLKFRLTHQDNLEQLLLVGLEIGKQAQLFEQFEQFECEILCFVNNQQDVFPLLDFVEEDIVDLLDEAAAAPA